MINQLKQEIKDLEERYKKEKCGKNKAATRSLINYKKSQLKQLENENN